MTNIDKNKNKRDLETAWFGLHQGSAPDAKEQAGMLAVLKDNIGASAGEVAYPSFLEKAFKQWLIKMQKPVAAHFKSRDVEFDQDDTYLWGTKLTKDGIITTQKWAGYVNGGTWPKSLRASFGSFNVDEDLYISPVGEGIEEDEETVTDDRDNAGGTKKLNPNDRKLQGLPIDSHVLVYLKPSKDTLIMGWKEIEGQSPQELLKLVKALGLERKLK